MAWNQKKTIIFASAATSTTFNQTNCDCQSMFQAKAITKQKTIDRDVISVCVRESLAGNYIKTLSKTKQNKVSDIHIQRRSRASWSAKHKQKRITNEIHLNPYILEYARKYSMLGFFCQKNRLEWMSELRNVVSHRASEGVQPKQARFFATIYLAVLRKIPTWMLNVLGRPKLMLLLLPSAVVVCSLFAKTCNCISTACQM